MDPEQDSKGYADLISLAQSRCFYYGMMPSQFWIQTPHETGVWHKAMAEHDNDLWKRTWQQTFWNGWHSAYFQRIKTMPKYERYLEMIGIESNKRQTPEQMMAVAEQMTIALGGKPRQKPESETN